MGNQNSEGMQELETLLKRRDRYFELTEYEKNKNRSYFEKMQKRIMHLKLCFDIYHDELDTFEITFDYIQQQEKAKVVEEAVERREIRLLKKSYNPEEHKAVYVALGIKDKLTDAWMQELYEMHQLRREGLIRCPWPTKI